MSSLQVRLGELITAIGTDWKNFNTKIGTGSLNTTATNLIAAINEVKVTADAAAGGSIDLDSLTDVVISSPATGHLLRHNGTNFVNVLGTTHFEVAGAVAAAAASYQPVDSDLTAIAALSTTTFGRSLLTQADAAATITTLGLASIYQPIDSDLTSIAALTTTSYGRAFLALANQAALMALLSASSSTAQGIVELATDAETTTGTDTARATTPANVKAAIDARFDSNTALGTSNVNAPTQNAVKTYVDGIIDAANGMSYKGVIDASANPNYPAASAGHLYRISVAGKIGGASGPNVEVGDTILCLTDSTSAGNHATVGANWNIIQSNIDGAVVGPASAVSANFATFSGTSGKIVQDSGYSFDTDGTLAANSATRIPSQSAVKTYAQPLDSDLTSIAALSTTSYGRAVLTLADQAALLALLPAPTLTTSGVVELATDAEVTTGTDDVRYISPIKLRTNIGNPDTDLAAAYATAKA